MRNNNIKDYKALCKYKVLYRCLIIITGYSIMQSFVHLWKCPRVGNVSLLRPLFNFYNKIVLFKIMDRTVLTWALDGFPCKNWNNVRLWEEEGVLGAALFRFEEVSAQQGNQRCRTPHYSVSLNGQIYIIWSALYSDQREDLLQLCDLTSAFDDARKSMLCFKFPSTSTGIKQLPISCVVPSFFHHPP